MQVSKQTKQQYRRNYAIEFKHFASFTSKCKRIHSMTKQKPKIKTKSIIQAKKVNLQQNNSSRWNKPDKCEQIIKRQTKSFDQQKTFFQREAKNNNGYQQLFTEYLKQTNQHSQDIQGEYQIQSLLIIPINHQITRNRKIFKNTRSKSLSSRIEFNGSKEFEKSSKQAANILRYYRENTSQINRLKVQASPICKKIELIRPQNQLNQFLKSLNIQKQIQNNFTNSKRQRKNKHSLFKQPEKIQIQLSSSTNNFLNEVNQTIIRYKNLGLHKSKPKGKIITQINPTQQPIIGWNTQENPQAINIL